MDLFLQAILLGIAVAGFIFLFKRNKTRSFKSYAAYYAKKRGEFPWLENWFNEYAKKNINIMEVRAQEGSGRSNRLSIVVFVGIVFLSSIFFGTWIHVQIISLGAAFLIAELLAKRSAKNPGYLKLESGLTLECPSCHCPHSWVMLQKENIVENKETITKTTTRKGYGQGDFVDSLAEGFKKDGTTKKVTIVYTGKSIKDFKCLNCEHTEHNVYEETWHDDEPVPGEVCNPPKPAWKTPGS